MSTLLDCTMAMMRLGMRSSCLTRRVSLVCQGVWGVEESAMG